MDLLPSYYKFEIRDDSPFGKGIFAKDTIRNNEIICSMKGPLISTEQHIEKYGSLMFTDPMQIDKDIYIDLIEPYRVFNHSCDPNAGLMEDGILFALKEIRPNEEIFYDYSTTCHSSEWFMDCGCSSPHCRGSIAEFESIPVEKRQYYYERNAIPSYLKNRQS